MYREDEGKKAVTGGDIMRDRTGVSCMLTNSWIADRRGQESGRWSEEDGRIKDIMEFGCKCLGDDEGGRCERWGKKLGDFDGTMWRETRDVIFVSGETLID